MKISTIAILLAFGMFVIYYSLGKQLEMIFYGMLMLFCLILETEKGFSINIGIEDLKRINQTINKINEQRNSEKNKQEDKI